MTVSPPWYVPGRQETDVEFQAFPPPQVTEATETVEGAPAPAASKTTPGAPPAPPGAPGSSRKRIARRYTPSEKARALECAAAHGVSAAAEKFGASRFAIYDWQRKLEKANAGKGPSPTSGPAPREIEEQRDREILGEWRKHPGLGPSQIRNQLRRRGIKVSITTARRVMEDAGYRPPKVKREPHDERYELDTRDPRTHARTLVQLLATTFYRALNRAPRRDRGGKTRVDLYTQPTPEQREAAREALRERLRKQELARQTLAARLDPAMRALLDDAFARLDLLDPERHFRDSIACYPRDAIVDAIAIFDGKRRAGTLPEGVDARYLLGIVKNVHHVHRG